MLRKLMRSMTMLARRLALSRIMPDTPGPCARDADADNATASHPEIFYTASNLIGKHTREKKGVMYLCNAELAEELERIKDISLAAEILIRIYNNGKGNGSFNGLSLLTATLHFCSDRHFLKDVHHRLSNTPSLDGALAARTAWRIHEIRTDAFLKLTENEHIVDPVRAAQGLEQINDPGVTAVVLSRFSSAGETLRLIIQNLKSSSLLWYTKRELERIGITIRYLDEKVCPDLMNEETLTVEDKVIAAHAHAGRLIDLIIHPSTSLDQLRLLLKEPSNPEAVFARLMMSLLNAGMGHKGAAKIVSLLFLASYGKDSYPETAYREILELLRSPKTGHTTLEIISNARTAIGSAYAGDLFRLKNAGLSHSAAVRISDFIAMEHSHVYAEEYRQILAIVHHPDTPREAMQLLSEHHIYVVDKDESEAAVYSLIDAGMAPEEAIRLNAKLNYLQFIPHMRDYDPQQETTCTFEIRQIFAEIARRILDPSTPIGVLRLLSRIDVYQYNPFPCTEERQQLASILSRRSKEAHPEGVVHGAPYRNAIS